VTPYYEQDGITIYHGDALRVLAELPDGCASLLLGDPPYSSGGMLRGDRQQDVHTKYVASDSESGNKLPTFTGDSRDARGFGYWASLWLGESRRLVGPGGIAAAFVDWRQLPMMTDALQAGGYVWRGIVAWHKPSARPTQGRWANACEYVVWGTNGPRSLEGNGFPGYFKANAPPSSEREHITQKPVQLLVDMLCVLPRGECVIDPFMGSGTTLVAAHESGRRAIGVEIEERYCEIAARRLEEARAQQTLPLEASA
jgi:site-specific DNA-methyltransferase (adenine-specific)